MNLKHLGISALTLGLLVGGGAAYSTFASANNEVNTNKANAVYESKVNFTGAGSYSFNGADELPEGVIRMDKVHIGDTDAVAESYALNRTDKLPEGTFRTDAILNGEIKN